MIPFGANVPVAPTRTELQGLLAQRKQTAMTTCRILFVGADWERKGGELVVDAVRVLRSLGVPAQLTIVGCAPEIDLPSDVTFVRGRVDKNTAEGRAELDDLFRSSHFFLVPSRAEAYGFVFSEAAAYGLPVLSTSTGGIPMVVKHDTTGFLFPVEAPAQDYAARIRRIWSSWQRYEELARNAHARYESTLNWQVWGAAVRDELRALCAR